MKVTILKLDNTVYKDIILSNEDWKLFENHKVSFWYDNRTDKTWLGLAFNPKKVIRYL